jgi:hypothetical protein
MPPVQEHEEPLEKHEGATKLCPDILNARDYPCCPWATSAFGFDWNSERWILVQVTCKRWGCPYCAVRKIRRLAWMSRNAEPTSLVTVTVSVHRYHDGKAAWDAMAPAWPELIRYARKLWGEIEYLRVLELQQNGMPHFHAMLRAPFLPQQPLRKEWRRLIGEPDAADRVDRDGHYWAGLQIKAIDSTFRTFRYLVKYLSKLHKLPWTDRHVSYSKQFFREADTQKVEWAKLDQVQKRDEHPFKFLRERFAWETVLVPSDGRYVLPTYPPDPYTTIDAKTLGLPHEKPPEPASTPAQRLIPGVSEADLTKIDEGIDQHGRRRRRRRKHPILPPARTPGPTTSAAPEPNEF